MKEIQTIIGNTKAGIALVGLMLIGLVSSCSSDDGADADEQQWAAGAEIGGVNSYMTYFVEEDMQTRAGEGLTRAWELPKDPGITYESYLLGDQSSIGVWFTRDESEDPAQELGGYLYKSGENWRMNFPNVNDVKGGKKYYVYGYVPHTPGISSSITPGSESKYANGATLTLTNVPSVMPNDLCVIIGAKDGPDKEHDNGLHRGDFAYTTAASVANNFVFLAFDHLYAAIRIKMRVYDDYAALRTIKLKSLKLSTKVGETINTDHTDIDIVLTPNNSGADPIQSITYTPAGSATDGGMEFWSSEEDEGQTLTTSYQEFTGHFMPSDVTTLVLTSEYDVYDRKGNLVRGKCMVTNTMVLNDLLTEQTTTKRGYRYTINMTIQPTYLYMLSEPDLDNPTVVLEP